MAEADDGARAPISQTLPDPTPPEPLDSELVRLRRELDSVHAARLAREASGDTSEEILKPLHERQWQLREEIDRTAATGFAGLFAKARAAEIAIERDGEPDDTGPGSFDGLALSLVRDLKAIQERTDLCPLARLANEVEEVIGASGWIDAKSDRPGSEKVFDHFEDRLRALRDQALSTRASSMRGALFQTFVLASEIDTMFNCEPPPPKDSCRQILRGLYSLAAALEEIAGERLFEARHCYLPYQYDPFLQMAQAIADWRADPKATPEEAGSEET